MATTLAERFWGKVEKTDGCWLWRGALFSAGYGHICDSKRKNWPAHRLAWTLTCGPIPAGSFVLHRCDVRACVRPDHLFLGTQSDNMRDAVQKGRHVTPLKAHPHLAARGDAHGARKHPETVQRGDAHWTRRRLATF